MESIYAASGRIGQILTDARRGDVRITMSALKVITGLVEGEMQRWYSYTDMIRETAAALKEDRA
jgi:hypothetical protein